MTDNIQVLDLSCLPSEISTTAEALSQRIDFYEINEKGGNSWVLIGCQKILNRKVVVKFYYWGDGAHMEPRLLSDLASTHVLKVDDAASIDKEYAYFITPYCNSGDLDDLISKGPLDIKKCIDMITDIAAGANFIHYKGYIHRDLKPTNIFCNDNSKLVIGDFGSVVTKGENGYTETKSRHSLLYRTPEEIKDGRAYPQGDVYQIGIILYQLMGGYLPYDEKDWLNSKQLSQYNELSHPDNQIFANNIIERKITSGKLLDYNSLSEWCPKEIKRIIKKCCATNIENRLNSPDELISKLNNIRSTIPDWKFEPNPVLYKEKTQIKIINNGNNYSLLKKSNTASQWRKFRANEVFSLRDAVTAALDG